MFPMLLIQILIVLLVVGVILWGLTQFPIDPTILKLIRVVIVVVVAIWLIYTLAAMLGVGHPLLR